MICTMKSLNKKNGIRFELTSGAKKYTVERENKNDASIKPLTMDV